MTTPSDAPDDRLLVRDGWRHYRRTYSLAEVRWGLAIAAVLLAILAWVMWRGAHPDPRLFQADVTLLEGAAASAVDRGALPEGLAGEGWEEEKIGQYDAENLYVRINGRSDFFISFGFQRLYAISLVSDDASVDIEMYDMGSGANALGAYMGEKAAEAQAQVEEAGVHHLERNALYFTRGRHYVRLIGSDETPAIQNKLRSLHATFVEALDGEPLPWAYGLFVGQMGLEPGKVSYLKENAFSFGFAKDVYAVDVSASEEDSTEIFVVARETPAQAKDLAVAFMDGFAGYGEEAETVAGVKLVKDRYIETRAGVKAHNRFVIGVRGAPDAESAGLWLGKLAAAMADMTPALEARAQPAVAEGAGETGAGETGAGEAEAAGEGEGGDHELDVAEGRDEGEDGEAPAGGKDMYGNPIEE